MGKPKVKTQPVPDPNEIIETQARVNRVDTVSPFGSTRFVNSGSAPTVGNGKSGSPMNGAPSGSEFTQVTELSPELQAVFNASIGEALTPAGGANFEGRALPSPVADVALSSPERGSAVFDPTRIEDALFERQTRLLEPQFAAREEGLRQNLADRGIPEGAEQFDFLLNQELDAQNRSRQDAALSAVLAGRDALNDERQFGLASDAFDQSTFEADRQLANLLNNQDFSQRLQLDEGDRNFFLNQESQELNRDQIQFSQLAQLLGLTPSTPIQPIDATGAFNLSNQVGMNNVNAQNAARQGAFGVGDLFGLGGQLGAAALLASDANLKTNLERIGETSAGLPLYSFDWKDGRDAPTVGVLAQDVQKAMPDAVHDIDGVLHVDYSMVGEI